MEKTLPPPPPYPHPPTQTRTANPIHQTPNLKLVLLRGRRLEPEALKFRGYGFGVLGLGVLLGSTRQGMRQGQDKTAIEKSMARNSSPQTLKLLESLLASVKDAATSKLSSISFQGCIWCLTPPQTPQRLPNASAVESSLTRNTGPTMI